MCGTWRRELCEVCRHRMMNTLHAWALIYTGGRMPACWTSTHELAVIILLSRSILGDATNRSASQSVDSTSHSCCSFELCSHDQSCHFCLRTVSRPTTHRCIAFPDCLNTAVGLNSVIYARRSAHRLSLRKHSEIVDKNVGLIHLRSGNFTVAVSECTMFPKN